MGSSLWSEHHNCQLGKSTCTMWACLLLGVLGSAAAKTIYPVPEPYRWEETFTVEFPQMDDEHRGLFNAILKIERDNSCTNVKEANVKYHDHSLLEQSLFKQTMSKHYIDDHMSKHSHFLGRFDKWEAPVAEHELTWAKNWLVQHIKNTDFKYIGLMPHHVPKPYHWDDSVETFYKRIDDEHKILFDHIRAIGHSPMSTEDLSNLKSKMRAHFDYESGLFCNAETYYDCEEHNSKHNTFFKQLYAIQVPVSKKDFEWAANWLVQHIINTDFDYKSKLNTYIHEVPRPYVWNTNFEVFYERLDNEHKLLFDAIRHVVDKPDDAGLYEALKTMMADHFVYEQAEFLKIPNFEEWAQDHIAKHDAFMEQLTTHSVPLDCDFVNFVENWFVQHVMNTDFAYRGKMVHDIPAPYIWDESFMTFYKRIDDEHKVLFDCIRECSDDPSDAEKYAFCKTKLRTTSTTRRESSAGCRATTATATTSSTTTSRPSSSPPTFPSPRRSLTRPRTGWLNTSRTPTLPTVGSSTSGDTTLFPNLTSGKLASPWVTSSPTHRWTTSMLDFSTSSGTLRRTGTTRSCGTSCRLSTTSTSGPRRLSSPPSGTTSTTLPTTG